MADRSLTRDALGPVAEGGADHVSVAVNVPAVLAAYLAAITLAEVIITFYPLPTGAIVGIIIHMAIVASLLSQASVIYRTDEGFSRFLVAMVLVPMVRIFSLSLPLTGLQILQALAIISIPLLAAPFAVMQVLGLTPRALGLALGDRRFMLLQASLALTGLPLGAIEYFILRPGPSWLPTATILSFVLGATVVIVASGLTEELIFRGILLGEGERLVGSSAALVYVTLLFMVMHIGFASVVDLIFVFLVGLSFGIAVQMTKNLVGVTFAHGLANVVLYLVMPLYF